ncbi:MAG: hypothetical protein M1827_006918 [Pycnora praestabilis]|nr:MAG: hypothetical protein M1827_006918 [Pycnora praestabilis]
MLKYLSGAGAPYALPPPVSITDASITSNAPRGSQNPRVQQDDSLKASQRSVPNQAAAFSSPKHDQATAQGTKSMKKAKANGKHNNLLGLKPKKNMVRIAPFGPSNSQKSRVSGLLSGKVFHRVEVDEMIDLRTGTKLNPFLPEDVKKASSVVSAIAKPHSTETLSPLLSVGDHQDQSPPQLSRSPTLEDLRDSINAVLEGNASVTTAVAEKGVSLPTLPELPSMTKDSCLPAIPEKSPLRTRSMRQSVMGNIRPEQRPWPELRLETIENPSRKPSTKFLHGPIKVKHSPVETTFLSRESALDQLDWSVFQVATGYPTIDLERDGDNSPTVDDLLEWFESFGFESEGIMIRDPRDIKPIKKTEPNHGKLLGLLPIIPGKNEIDMRCNLNDLGKFLYYQTYQEHSPPPQREV